MQNSKLVIRARSLEYGIYKRYETDGWAKDDLVYEWIPEGPVQVMMMITMMIIIMIRDALQKEKTTTNIPRVWNCPDITI